MSDTPDGLSSGLACLGVRADTAQIKQLHAWLQLLDRWNGAFNLTAIPAEQRAAQFGLMSAAAIEYLKAGSVIDVGSGAGVPGVTLAILAQENDYTLIDSNAKKTRFLEQCRMELGLDNVRVVHARVEDFEGAAFDTIISRAFAGVSEFLDKTRHLAHAETEWLSFKGAGALNEAQHLSADRAKWQLHRLQIPGLDQPTSLVVVREQQTKQ